MFYPQLNKIELKASSVGASLCVRVCVCVCVCISSGLVISVAVPKGKRKLVDREAH